MSLANIAPVAVTRTPASAPLTVRRVVLVMSDRRLRLGVGPTFSVTNGRGERIALVSVVPRGLGSARAAAARMAYSAETTGALRLASIDYEQTGAVLPETISLMRRLLDDIGAA